MAAAHPSYRTRQDSNAAYDPYTPAEPFQNAWQATHQTTIFGPNPTRSPHATPLKVPANVARDLPTEEALSLEIEKLCTATLVIDQAFFNIGRRLSDISNEQNKRVAIYGICYALETRWDQHYMTYKDLIWRSRDFAGEAQGAVDDFREHVLPSLKDRQRSRSQKQEIIQAQVKVLQDRSQPSQKLCQDFLDFGRALDTYITDFSRDVEGLETGEQSIMVDGLKDRLSSTKTRMEVLSKEVKELGWKLAADIAVAGVAILLAFLAPTFWAKVPDVRSFGMNCKNVMGSIVQFIEKRGQYDLAVTAYEATKAEYELESACLSQMVKLESTLHEAKPLIHEVTIKLGIFASVWAAITADMRKLKSSLQYADDPASPLFVLRVEKLEKMYNYLSQALRHYQVTVQLPRLGEDAYGEKTGN